MVTEMRDLPDDFQLEHLEAVFAFIPINRRGLAIDIGAHRGIWTKRLSEVFDNVMAFEPNVEVYNRIPDIFNVTKFNNALGSFSGKVSLKAGEKNTGQTHCIAGQDVDIFQLDAFSHRCPDFIKIDVEGMEFDVLKGGKKIILAHKPFIMIEENGLGERYGHKPYRASELLKRWGAKKLMTVHMEPEKDVNVLFGWSE